MAINSLDIKFRQSEVMLDVPEGGGSMSAVEIVDGDMNNVFGDRSDLDAILGRVSLRKMHLHIDTHNTDTGLGAFVFLADPPQDPLVSVTLFNTASPSDRRTAAQNYVEAYRVKSNRTQMTLYGLHMVGQRTVMVFCRPETPSPDIADVLCLSTERAGYTPVEQYVRVQEVASRTATTFEDGQGTFTYDVMIIQITTPLAHEFHGRDEPSRRSDENRPPTVVRATQVQSAASYYTVKSSTALAATGDMIVHIESPYTQIVPASQAETPVVDQLAGLGSVAFPVAGAADALTFSGQMSASAGETVARFFGSPYARRSLHIIASGVDLRDDGNGNIIAEDAINEGWSGVADYMNGTFALSHASGFSGSVSATATPAGMVAEQVYSYPHIITANNRANSYVFQMPGQTSPGTVILDYRALGKWIRLTDNGRGQLVGNPGEGSGTVNYQTGSVAITLGALPDVDSALILAWGTDLRTWPSAGEITIPDPLLVQQLDNPGATPGTLVMTWESGGTPRTATADAAGQITGDATGTLDHVAGLVQFRTAHPADTQYHYAYDYIDPADVRVEQHTPDAYGSVITMQTADPVQAGSLSADWWLATDYDGVRSYLRVIARDNAAGGFTPGQGSIDYANGAITLRAE